MRWPDFSVRPFSRHPRSLIFHADFGLHAYRAGIEEAALFWFNGYSLQLVSPIHQHLFTVASTCSVNDREHMISFDFDAPAFEKVIAALPEDDRSRVREALERNPFQADLEGKSVSTAPPSSALRFKDHMSFSRHFAL
jgi:hypothetical protein